MPRQYGPKGWSARKEGKDFASNFLHDLQGVTTEVTWGDELWDRLGEAPHADQVWSYVFPMLLSVAVRRPEDMGFGAGYSVATLCEVLSHIFGAAIERVVLPPPQYHPMRSAHEGAAAAPVEAHLEAQLSGPGPSEHGMHEETVRVSGVFDLLTPGPQACSGLKPVAVAPDLFALKTSRSGLTTVAGFVGTDHVCSITYFPRHNILVDVDLRGSLSNKTSLRCPVLPERGRDRGQRIDFEWFSRTGTQLAALS